MSYQPEISASNRKYVSPSFAQSAPYYYPNIQAAIDSITDASLANPYAIYVYPGVYNESITLKSFVSIIGSGVQSTTIKGDGNNPAITGTTDSGGGQCSIVGLSIDGNGLSAINLPSSSTSEQFAVYDAYIFTSVTTGYPAVSVSANQGFTAFNLHCINGSTKYYEGILATGTAQVRLRNSQIAYTSGYCIDHQSSGVTEVSQSMLVGGAACYCSAGLVNIYLCMTVGRIDAYSSSRVKHVDSFHANAINSYDSSTIWITGLGWAEQSGNDISINLYGSQSKVILANSRVKVATGSSLDLVSVNSSTAAFKAFNSVLVNQGTGATIRGIATPDPTVYCYYNVFNAPPVGVTLHTEPGGPLVTANAE